MKLALLLPSLIVIRALAPPAPLVHCVSSDEQIVTRPLLGWPLLTANALPPDCDQLLPRRRHTTSPSRAPLISFWIVPRLVALVNGPRVQVCASTRADATSTRPRS